MMRAALSLRFEAWLLLSTIVGAFVLAHERAMLTLALGLTLLLALAVSSALRELKALGEAQLKPLKPLPLLHVGRAHTLALTLVGEALPADFRLQELDHSGECELELSPQHLKLNPKRPGDFTLLSALTEIDAGFGLFRVRAWIPMQIHARVALSRPTQGASPSDRQRHQRPLARPGDGHELYELRDHAPSDPMRHIAWLASIKRQRLLVRQPMDEGAPRALFLLDVSAAMWIGPVGLAPIDEALRHLQARVHALPAEGEFGLVAFSHGLDAVLPMGVKSHHLGTFPKLLHQALTRPQPLDISEEDLLSALASVLQRDLGERHLYATQNVLPQPHLRLDATRAPSTFEIPQVTKGTVIGSLARHTALTPHPLMLEEAAWRLGLRLPRAQPHPEQRLNALTRALSTFPHREQTLTLLTEPGLLTLLEAHRPLKRRLAQAELLACQERPTSRSEHVLEGVLAKAQALAHASPQTKLSPSS